MKFVYCIHSVCNPGGMERVLLNKVSWLVGHGHEVTVVTTDQHGRPPFYPFPPQVRFIDLDVNYSDDNSRGVAGKVLGYLRRRRRHRRGLTAILMRERPDITVTLFPCESGFIPGIRDGSRKVLEFHYSKHFRLQYGRTGILGLIDRLRTTADERLMRRYDRFVVLTHEDAGAWPKDRNISVIPNAALQHTGPYSDQAARRVIAVGRLDYQKGFDRLVKAWGLVSRSPQANGWRLDIFGQGEWRQMLEDMISQEGVQATCRINPPTKRIADEYAASSLMAMSSHYEGFPMVMVEAMGAGLPVVTFGYKCGPRDIIDNGVNGIIVADGDIEGLAHALLSLMGNDGTRIAMGLEARKVTGTYSQDKIMGQWMELFTDLTRKSI